MHNKILVGHLSIVFLVAKPTCKDTVNSRCGAESRSIIQFQNDVNLNVNGRVSQAEHFKYLNPCHESAVYEGGWSKRQAGVAVLTRPLTPLPLSLKWLSPLLSATQPDRTGWGLSGPRTEPFHFLRGRWYRSVRVILHRCNVVD